MPTTPLQRVLFLCRQRRPVASAIIPALPLSAQSSAPKNPHRGVSTSIRKSGGCFRGYGRTESLAPSPAHQYNLRIPSSRMASNAPHINNFTIASSLGKICTSDTIAGKNAVQIRTFRNVGEYHDVADETLHSIQDAVEDFLEEYYDADSAEKEDDIPEVNYASGVLTMYLPPHGTWVINKQTPNEQIWWSSPISGPRRYEYDEKMERWVYSRVVDEEAVDDMDEKTYSEEDTLGGILNKEFKELFGEGLGMDDEFHC